MSPNGISHPNSKFFSTRYRIASHDDWVEFQDHLPEIVEHGELRILKIVTWKHPHEITDWSFLLKIPFLGNLEFGSWLTPHLPVEICEMPKLTSLKIFSRISDPGPSVFAPLPLTTFPPEIWDLPHLTELCVFNTKISLIPSEIGRLHHLERLDISHNHISELPPELFTLQNLDYLNISRNQISTLPPDIGQLKNLTALDVAENQITEIPPEIGQLTALEYLDIEQWPPLITALPLTMANCPHITEIKGVKQVEPIPLSIYVNWPKYHKSGISVLLPPESDYWPDLEKMNPAFHYTYARGCKFVFYPIERLFQDLLDGKEVSEAVFGRLYNNFTRGMKDHLRNVLPRNHPFVKWLDETERWKLSSGYSIQR